MTKSASKKEGAQERGTETLGQAEERYQSLFENAVNGIFHATPAGHYVSVNPALAAMHGFASPADMLAAVKDIEGRYVSAEGHVSLKELLEDRGSVSGFEARLPRKGGDIVWVSISARAVKDSMGRIVRYEGFVEDITLRKRTEEALQKEKKTFFAILDNDPVGVILTDREGVYVFVNREFTNVTGYTREDVPTGADWFNKAYPDRAYRKKVLAAWEENAVSEGGEWIDVEFTITCKDGQTKDIEFRTTFLKDYSITVLKDVTKRKQAEKALQESEEKFRRLFEKSADPILLIDGGRFIDCNGAALQLMHCPPGRSLIGLTLSDISPELQPEGSTSFEKAEAVIRSALREGRNRFEWMNRAFDGADFWVDVSFTVIRVHEREIIYAVWRDITDRKRAEEALRQTEEKYRNIFENATEGIFQTTLAGGLLSANPAFARLFGYESPEEMLESVEDITHEIYSDPRKRDELKRLLDEQGFARNFEVECRRRDGNTIWISANVRVVRAPAGKVLFYEGTLSDITERKNIQEDLENKSLSLEEANAALRVLLKHREQDSHELEEKVVCNIKELVLPYVERLKESRAQNWQAMADIIESNLNEIMSPFSRHMASRYASFTPKEIQIADLIKKGKTTKEMSLLLGLSTRTIDIHRYNIRRKLNLNKKKINLQSYLMSLS